MLAHFDFFKFYDLLLVVACDAKDTIIGYFCLQNGNELCQVYIAPSHRGTGVIHLLIWEAVTIVKGLGFPTIWGVFYDPLFGFYTQYMKKWGAPYTVLETPEERSDGQWKLIFDITTIDPDRRPELC
jgi:GNAT superfamily N-acetyltransferase